LFERMQGRIDFALRTPTSPAKDFNDHLLTQGKSNAVP
jgi:hypothetical protein